MKNKPHITLKVFFIFIVLLSTKFFSFILIDKQTVIFLELLLLSVLIFLCMINPNKVRGSFKNIFSYLILFSFSASIPAYLYHDQSFQLSFFALRSVLFIFLYRFLHLYSFKKEYVLKVLFFIGLIWLVIMIVQSITFPQILFANRVLEVDEYYKRSRGNILRINISDVRFAVLLFMSLVIRYFNFKKISVLFYVIILFYGFYLTGTRQIIFTALALFVLIFYSSNQLRSTKFFNIIIIIPLIIYSMPNILLFYELFVVGSVSTFDSNYIRFLSAKFYFFDFWPDYNPVIAYFFGNGPEHGSSDYGKIIMNYHWEKLNFFRDDIGLIGALNQFGIFYVLTCCAILYKFIKHKYSSNYLFIKYFFIFLILTSITALNFFLHSPTILIIACLAFIADKNIIVRR